MRGTKHVLLYPPELKPLLGYSPRRDIQAHFSPVRGEYGRRDTGIISDNTAAVNLAAADVLQVPRVVASRRTCHIWLVVTIFVRRQPRRRRRAAARALRRGRGVDGRVPSLIWHAPSLIWQHARYAEVEASMVYGELREGDCLFLPTGWHHHVFSQVPHVVSGHTCHS